MWEFSIFRALGLMIRTLPFIVFRAAVFFGIAVVVLIGTGAGAGIGHLLADGTSDLKVLWGGAAGALLVAGMLHLRRDLLLHRIRAGHAALMVEALDRRRVPFSPTQITLAQAVVTERFADSAALLALDRLIRGVIRTATALVDEVLDAPLPLPVVDRFVRATGLHMWLTVPLIEEVILAHAVRTRSENAWEAAHDGLVLYTQNARPMMTNAFWLSLLGWGLAGLVVLAVLTPAASVAVLLPVLPGSAILLAVAFAWAVKAALYDPFALGCLLQLHLRLTEGQEPLPEWRGRLTQVSDKFRLLGERALGWTSGVAHDA